MQIRKHAKDKYPGEAAFVKRLMTLVVLSNIFVGAIVSFAIYQSYVQTLKNAEIILTNYGKTLSSGLKVTFDQVDMTLQDLRAHYLEDGNNLEAFIDDIKEHEALDRNIIEISFTDKNGVVRYPVADPAAAPDDVSQREHFNLFKNKPDVGLFISGPLMGRIDKKWQILFSRRLDSADGVFAGDLGAPIGLDTLADVLSKVDVGENGVASLGNDKGFVARYSNGGGFDQRTIGDPNFSQELRDIVDSGTVGATYRSVSKLDHVRRLYAYQRIPGYPFFVNVGFADDTLYRDLRRLTVLLVGLALLFLAGSVVISRLWYVNWVQTTVAMVAGRRKAEEVAATLEATNRELQTNQATLHRLTNIYSALSQTNQVLVQSADQSTFLPEVCRIAVEMGGMKMAWAGRVDTATQRLVPVAYYGAGCDYVEGLDIPLDAEDTKSHGPSGVAVREDRAVWCQDFMGDPSLAPWHDRARTYGWRASAAVPLHSRGAVAGVLTIYSDEVDAFDETSQQLLLEMAVDIGFGLDRFGSETDRVNAEQLLRTERMLLKQVLHTIPDCVYLRDLNGVYQLCNYQVERILGVAEDQILGKTDYDYFDRETADFIKKKERDIVMSGKESQYEIWLPAIEEGRKILMQVDKLPMIDAEGRVTGTLGIARDITSVRENEAHLRLAASVFEHSHGGIVITDKDGNVIDVNKSFTDITGYDRSDIVGRNMRVLKSGLQGQGFYSTMWKAMVDEGYWKGEIWNRHKDGNVYAELLTVSAVRDQDDKISHYVGVFSDISWIKEHEQQLERIAHYDSLTQIPNRLLLVDRMRQAIAHSLRTGQVFAICYVDLDGFKPVNDTFGHDVGDQLLVAMAKRFQDCLRTGDTVGRLGGDEFVLILLGMENDDTCEVAVNRLMESICGPVQIGDRTVSITASMGISLYPSDGDDPDTLLRNADQAMYKAKQMGKNTFTFFDTDSENRARSHHLFARRFEAALANGEMVLHYQPKVNMRQGKVIGAEALVRWNHPEQGLLYPGSFLPSIEGTDAIAGLGDWVIGEALQQLSKWQEEGLDVSVSVNLAARHVLKPKFVEDLKRQLFNCRSLPHGRFELEALETAALEDVEQVSRIIDECSRLGVTFSLDDFGTGYSSLSYFKRLPADTLKIDQSFVRDMLKDAEDLAIVEGIIGLTEAFRRKVIAEGVETVDQGVALLCLGCELAQGYGIAKPMPAKDFVPWAKQWRPSPMWTGIKKGRHGHDDIPLLFGKSNFRQWSDLVFAEHSGRGDPGGGAVDAPLRQFQSWYNGGGRARYGLLEEYAEIGEYVHQANVMASDLMHKQRRHHGPIHVKTVDQFTELVEIVLNGLDDLLISPND